MAWNQLHFNFYMFALCLSMREERWECSQQTIDVDATVSYQTFKISSKSIISINFDAFNNGKTDLHFFFIEKSSVPSISLKFSAILETWSLLDAFFGICCICVYIEDLLIQLECHSMVKKKNLVFKFFRSWINSKN